MNAMLPLFAAATDGADHKAANILAAARGSARSSTARGPWTGDWSLA